MNLNQIGLEETDDVDIFTARMRYQRDSLLAACDWTQHSDAPVDRTAWAAYRQQLRDFPATWEPGPTADFPNPPGYVKPTVEEPAPEEPTEETVPE